MNVNVWGAKKNEKIKKDIILIKRSWIMSSVTARAHSNWIMKKDISLIWTFPTRHKTQRRVNNKEKKKHRVSLFTFWEGKEIIVNGEEGEKHWKWN